MDSLHFLSRLHAQKWDTDPSLFGVECSVLNIAQPCVAAPISPLMSTWRSSWRLDNLHHIFFALSIFRLSIVRVESVAYCPYEPRVAGEGKGRNLRRAAGEVYARRHGAHIAQIEDEPRYDDRRKAVHSVSVTIRCRLMYLEQALTKIETAPQNLLCPGSLLEQTQ